MKQFSCKTKICSGRDSLSVLGQMDIHRLLIVSDPYFAENGTAEKIAHLSGAPQWQIFRRVKPDPDMALVAEGTAALRAFAPDTVVALGGGSALDCAKAMVYFSELTVRLIAVPTTSGSGSEVTDFAVLTHDGVKIPLIDPSLCPDVAILDSALLAQLPPALIADTGFDVLAHGAESYVATGGNSITRALAGAAFACAMEVLPRSYSGQAEVRLKMHECSTMAGMAFSSAGLGVCHALSHALGGEFHLPHGRLNAILLPAVIDCNKDACLPLYASLARAAGFPGTADTVAVRNLKNGLIRLRRELGLPQTLYQAGVSPDKLRKAEKQLTEAALADPCCQTNPMPVTPETVRTILQEVQGNGA